MDLTSYHAPTPPVPPGTTARETMMQLNGKRYRVTIHSDAKYHYIDGNYNLKDEFSAMRGSEWLGRKSATNPNPLPLWKVERCRRNQFNLDYLEGKNPFARYKAPLDLTKFRIPTKRYDCHSKKEITLFAHQREFICHMLQRKQCIISGEMGTAKTLAAFIARELSLVKECWYVAPKSALTSVKVEATRWGVIAKIRFMTYDELKKVLSEWKPGEPPPQMVIYDECSRMKNGTSQRSQAGMYLAESMRDTYKAEMRDLQEKLSDKVFDEHSYNCYIILMSGSPAPKSPLDWYNLCEVACPGYIREGNVKKFDRRLSISADSSDSTGFSWKSRVAWRDGNPNVCGNCGLNRAAPCSCKGKIATCTQCSGVGTIDQHKTASHPFIPVDNQIELLYRRMAGLVLVKFKKDCLDLPEKIYRQIHLKPSRELMSAARIITSKCKSAVESLTLLRELSDGFQYKDTIEKTADCKGCNGLRVALDSPPGVVESCKLCSGTGVQNTVRRDVVEIPSPKLDALSELLDEVEEYGRLVVYAGFTAAIDRVCAHVKKLGWEYIKVDGRGWTSSIPGVSTPEDMLHLFQYGQETYGQIVFIGHPGSAGMGLTLTASNMIVYYSNDFNAESRIQSEDRIHRAGMDVNRGATIVDLLLLPTDKKVLDNLARKRELQSISLGELQHAIDNYSYLTASS